MRELDNVVQRALILHQGSAIEAHDLMFESTLAPTALTSVAGEEAGDDSLTGDLKDHERRLILGALSEGKGSRKFAAEKLGISPRTLRYKIARMRDEGVAVPGALPTDGRAAGALAVAGGALVASRSASVRRASFSSSSIAVRSPTSAARAPG